MNNSAFKFWNKIVFYEKILLGCFTLLEGWQQLVLVCFNTNPSFHQGATNRLHILCQSMVGQFHYVLHHDVRNVSPIKHKIKRADPNPKLPSGVPKWSWSANLSNEDQDKQDLSIAKKQSALEVKTALNKSAI